MPSFSDFAKQVQASNPQPSGGGGGSFSDFYRQIVQNNTQNTPLHQDQTNFASWQDNQGLRALNDQANQDSFSSNNQNEIDRHNRQERDQNEPKREANFFERLSHGIASIGDAMMPRFSTGNGAFDFIANTGIQATTGTLLAPLEGQEHLYEAATGADLDSIDDKGQMNSDPLTWQQRAGAGVSGLIDTAGLAVGGSGRAIGGAINFGRNMARADKGLDAAKPIFEGMISKNGSNNLATFGKQLGFDALEEGSEEAVQSVAEDFRYDQFDEGTLGRAAYAGSVGALAGGIMSAGGQLLNRAGQNLADKAQDRREALSQETTVPARSGNEFDYLSQANTNPIITPSSAEVINERAKQYASDRPGSTMARSQGGIEGTQWMTHSGELVGLTHTDGTEYRATPDDFLMGTENIQSMYERADNGESRNEVLQSLGMDEATFNDLFYENGQVGGRVRPTAAYDLTQHLMGKLENGDPSQWSDERQPSTNPTVRSKQNLVGVFDGSGYRTHPISYTRFKEDNDGDLKGLVALNGDSSSIPYKSEHIYNPESGSTLDFAEYSAISEATSEETIRNVVDQVLDNSRHITRSQTTNSSSNYRAFKNQLVYLLNNAIHYNYRTSTNRTTISNDALAQVFDSIDDLAREYGVDLTVDSHAGLVGDLIVGLESDPVNQYNSQIASVEKRAHDQRDEALAEAIEYVGADETYWLNGGTIGGKTINPVPLLRKFQHLVTLINERENSNFRKDGQLALWTKRVDLIMDDVSREISALDPNDQQTAFEIFMRYSMTVTHRGDHPSNNIEGMVLGSIRRNFMAEMASNPVKDNKSFDEMKETFVKVWNTWIEVYDKSREQMTSLGLREVDQLPKKTALNPKSENFDSKFWSSFNEVMGDVRMSLLMSIDSSSDLYRQDPTFNEYYRNRANRQFTTGGSTMNSATKRVLNQGYKAYHNRNKSLDSSIRAYLHNACSDLRKLFGGDARQIYNGELEGLQLNGLTFFLDSLDRLVGPALVLDYDPRLVAPEYFAQSEYGQAFIAAAIDDNQTSRDRAAVALMSLGYEASFKKARDYYAEYARDPHEGNPAWDHLCKELVKQSYVSPIRRAIADSIWLNIQSGAENPFAMLDQLTSLDRTETIETRQEWLEKICPNLEKDQSLLVDALTTEHSEFATSSIHGRLRRAVSVEKRVADHSYEELMKDYALWESLFDDDIIPEAAMPSLFEHMIDESLDEADIDQVAAMALDARGINNAYVNKNTTSSNASGVYQQVAIMQNGAVYSAQSMVSDVSLGILTKEQVLSNRRVLLGFFRDPTFSVEVYDPKDPNSRQIWDREYIMSTLGITLRPDQRMTPPMIRKLFAECPQLLRYAVPQGVGATMVNGEYTMRQGPKENIKEAWLSEYRDRLEPSKTESLTLRRQLNKAQNIVKSRLISMTGYPEFLIRYIAMKNGRDGDVTNLFTEGRLRSEMAQAHDEVSRYFLKQAISNGSTMLSERIVRQTSRSRAVSRYNQLQRAFQLERTLKTNAARMNDAYMREAFSEIARIVNSGVVDDTLSQIANRYGCPIGQEPSTYDAAVESYIHGLEEAIDRYYNTVMELIVISNVTSGFPDNGDFNIDLFGFDVDPEQAYIDWARQTDTINYTDDNGNVHTYRVGDPEFETIRDQAIANFEALRNSHRVNLDQMLDQTLALRPTDMQFEAGHLTAESRATILGKIHQIEDLTHTMQGTINDQQIIDRIESAQDVRNEYNRLQLVWNTALFDHMCREMFRDTGISLNANFIRAQYDMNSFELAAVRQCSDSLEHELGDFVHQQEVLSNDFFSKVPEDPQLDFSNPETDYLARRAKNFANEGMITTSIGMNGAHANDLASFAWVDDDLLCDSVPHEVTFREIQENIDQYTGCMYLVGFTGDPATWPQVRRDPAMRDTWELREIRPDSLPHFSPDATVYIFPRGEGTGFCACHGNNRLSNIIGKLNDNSQESMVLNSKKFINVRDEVVAQVSFATELRDKVQQVEAANRSNPDAIREQSRRFFFEFRQTMREYYTRLFASESFRDLHMTADDINTIVEIQTPAFIFYGSNGQAQVVNSDALMSGNFEFDEGITPIERVEVLTQSLTQMAKRIEFYVTRAWQEEAGGDFNQDIPHTAVRNAVQQAFDFTNYSVNSESGGFALAGLSPLRYVPSYNMYIAEDSPTRTMNFTQNVAQQVAGVNMFPGRMNRRGRVREYEVVDDKHHNIIERTTNSFVQYEQDNAELEMLLQGGGTISAAFLPSSNDPRGTVSDNVRQILMSVDPRHNKGWNKNASDSGITFGIVYDHKRLAEAVSWAERTGSNLIIVEDESYASNDQAYNEALNKLRSPQFEEEAIGLNLHFSTDSTMRFTAFTNKYTTEYREAVADEPQSYIVPLDPNSIVGRAMTATGRESDGATYVANSVADRIHQVGENVVDIQVGEALSEGTSPIMIASREVIMEHFGEHAGDDQYQPTEDEQIDFTGIREQVDKTPAYINTAIRAFLSRISNSNEEDGTIHTDVGRLDVVGFLSRVQANGELKFWPVFAPKSGTSKRMQIAELRPSYTGFEFYWYSESSLRDLADDGETLNSANTDAYKNASEGISDKNTARPTADEEFPYLATANSHGRKPRIGMVSSANTSAKRIADNERVFFINNLWNFTNKFGRSMFYERTSNGQYVLRPALRRIITSRPDGAMWVRLLLSNSQAAWNQVKIGAMDIAEDPETNQLIRSILRNNELNNVSWYDFFNNLEFTQDQRDALVSGNPVDVKIAKVSCFQMPVEMIIGALPHDDAMRFFNALDSRLCARSVAEDANNSGRPEDMTIFDSRGYTYIDPSSVMSRELVQMMRDENGDLVDIAVLVDWTPQSSIGKNTFDTAASASSASSLSSVNRAGLSYGYMHTDTRRLLAGTVARHNMLLWSHARNQELDLSDVDDSDTLVPIGEQTDRLGQTEFRYTSRSERDHIKSVRQINETFMDGKIIITDQMTDDPSAHKVEITEENCSGYRRLRRLLGRSDMRDLSVQDAINLACYQVGKTYNVDEHGRASGMNYMLFDHFDAALNAICDNIEQGADGRQNQQGIMLFYAPTGVSERATIPMPRAEDIDILWTYPRVRASWNYDKQAMIQAYYNELCASSSQLNNFADLAQRHKISDFMEFVATDNGFDPPNPYISHRQYMSDLDDLTNPYLQAIESQSVSGVFTAAVREGLRQSREYLAKIAKHNQEMASELVDNPAGPNGEQRIFRRTKDRYRKIVDNISAYLMTIKVFLNPLVAASNIITKYPIMGFDNLMLKLGRTANIPFNPYNNMPAIADETIHMVGLAQSDMEVFNTIMEANYSGTMMDLLNGNLDSPEKLSEWKRRQDAAATSTWPRKLFHMMGKSFWFFTGGNIGRKWQARIFVQRFALNAQAEGHTYWFDPMTITRTNERGEQVTTEVTRLDYEIMTKGFGGFLVEVMKSNSPDLVIASRALNQAQQGDIAQNTVPSILFQAWCERHPTFKLFTNTCISPFFRYAFSITGQLANLIAPVSTTHYIAAKAMSNMKWSELFGEKWAYLDNLPFDENQLNASLREAIMTDVVKMGIPMFAAIIAAMAGVMQPPEDPKKYNIPSEWTFLGMRIAEQWWLEDLLAMAAPLMCFWSSAGKMEPRIDILVNGVIDACYSNPIFRISDMADTILDPEGSIFSNYDKEAAQYADAPGGSPDLGLWMFANARNIGLSWLSQFALPGFVRDLYRTAPEYETSYKRIWQQDARGNLTESGEHGATQLTSFEDAKLRQLAHKNPMLAGFFNMWFHPNTSYSATDNIPLTVYYEDAQLESLKKYSLYDENGNAKTPQEQEAVIMEVVGILQATEKDDLETLFHQGFYIGYDTRAAVASTVWDTIQSLTDMKNEMVQAGIMNYKSDYYAGDPDAYAKVQQLNDMYYSEVRYWQNFYYDKLKSEWIDRPLQTYNRYNTTYQTDSEGNVFATGYHNNFLSNLSPFRFAPGTLDNPGNTAGWAGDWNSLSAVVRNDNGTGSPAALNQRALVPTADNYDDSLKLPDLESWSADGQGNGYSDRHNAMGYNANGYDQKNTNSSANPSGSNGNKSSGYPRSGGYSYTRRSGGGGGGGGGGGRPNLYSRVNTPYPSNPKTSNTHRYYDANFDYLRPDFETKGSREASRRSDF